MPPHEDDRLTPLDERRTWLPDGIPSQVGAYQFVRLLGQGGWGVVLEARHQMLGQRVAVKVLRPSLGHDPHFVDRFQREIAAVGRLEEHPNLVRARHAGQECGTLYLAMDFVEGPDLQRLARRLGRLPLAESCEVIRQAALGLAAIARAGLVHRDLKPSNLMLTPDGTVKVMDLGLARLRDPDGDGELTPSNVQMGTFDYQAPEQATDPRHVDVRADVYSLGCVLYRLLSGEPPFAGQPTPAAKIHAHAHRPFPPLGQDVPVRLGEVLRRMTAKEPAARFATPHEVAEALRPFATGANLAALVADGGPPADPASETSTVSEGPQLSAARTPAIRPRRWRTRAAVVLLCLALVGVVVAALPRLLPWTTVVEPNPDRQPAELPRPILERGGKGADPPTDPILAAGTVPRSLDELPAYEAHSILDRPPIQAHWDPADGTAFRAYVPDRRQLVVNSPRQALFHLGTIRMPSYVFQVQIKQPHWTRGAGIYLGYQTAGEGISSFQYLTFGEKSRGGERVFSLHRGRGTVKPLRGVPSFAWHDEAAEEIETPRQDAWVMVEVVGHRLGKVRVNGVELKRLTTHAVNNAFLESDYQGCLGVLSRANSCVFHQASVTTQPAR